MEYQRSLRHEKNSLDRCVLEPRSLNENLRWQSANFACWLRFFLPFPFDGKRLFRLVFLNKGWKTFTAESPMFTLPPAVSVVINCAKTVTLNNIISASQ